MDLSKFVVLSADGTFFAANSAFLIDTSKLTEEQLDLLNEGTDSDRFDLTVTDGLDLEQMVDDDRIVADLHRIYYTGSNFYYTESAE
jgi:hypothetical protein